QGKSRSRLDQGIQYRLKIESGAADDLEHIGGGGLLLGRFAQLVEQPGGLDGGDGLRGGILKQLYLLVAEWGKRAAIYADRTNQFVFFEHRYHQIGPRPSDFDEGHHAGIFSDVGRIGTEVRNVDNLLGRDNAFEWDSRIVAQVEHGIAKPRIGMAFRAVDCNRAKDRSFLQEQISERGLAYVGCIRQQCIEDRLKFAGRS